MQGSRVLAFTAAVLGFTGLALSLAGGPIGAVGLAMAGLALLSLLAVAWMALEAQAPQLEAPPPELVPAPTPDLDFGYAEADRFPEQGNEAAVEWEAPPPVDEPSAPTPAPAAAIDLDSPLQRALAGLPPKPSAPNRYSPRMPVIPEEDEEAEPVRRARRLVPSGQTLGEKREAAKKAKARPAPEEMEFTVVPSKPRAATRPAVVPTPQVPLVVARVAGKGPAPPT
ncbi:MAG: hypothetical protein ABR586_08360 [Thermoplasmatota archaeon]